MCREGRNGPVTRKEGIKGAQQKCRFFAATRFEDARGTTVIRVVTTGGLAELRLPSSPRRSLGSAVIA
jgi:hypothetical protein